MTAERPVPTITEQIEQAFLKIAMLGAPPTTMIISRKGLRKYRVAERMSAVRARYTWRQLAWRDARKMGRKYGVIERWRSLQRRVWHHYDLPTVRYSYIGDGYMTEHPSDTHVYTLYLGRCAVPWLRIAEASWYPSALSQRVPHWFHSDGDWWANYGLRWLRLGVQWQTS